jgi:outer membrane immunogenic protein
MKLFAAAAVLTVACAGVASAADLPARIYTKAPVETIVYDWTGFYVGGQVGAASMSSSFKDNDDTFDNQGLNPDRKFGVTGGVYGGYNWQIHNFILGVDTQWSWYGKSEISSAPDGVATSELLSTKLRNAGSVKARLGLALDDTMVYVAAGPAWGNFDFHALNVADNGSFDSRARSTVTGLAIAAGVEHMITPNWVVRGQVQYTEFGTQHLDAAPDAGFGQQTNLLEATAGLSYKFGVPTLAKY